MSTDGGGERQQWFALIREPANPNPTPNPSPNPTPGPTPTPNPNPNPNPNPKPNPNSGEPAGGVDPEPTADDPHPKLRRLREEFSDTTGDADGNVWDPFALELINAASEEDIKRRDLYDGAPLLATLNPQRLLSPWAKVS